MLLAIDIGNTNITLGLFPVPEGRRAKPKRPPIPKTVKTWRLATRGSATADDYGPHVLALLKGFGRVSGSAAPGAASSASGQTRALSGVAVASVVPSLDPAFRELSQSYLGQPALFVEPGVDTGVRVLYRPPADVGADRVVNAAAAHARVRGPCIVVDFGTATTFDCVNAQGGYQGGVIAPGPQMAADALAQRTAKLPRLEGFRKPPKVVGSTTRDSIASGLYYGYIGLTEEILRRLKGEMGGSPVVLATGGLAPLLAPEINTINRVVPDLTLEGLYWIWQINCKI